MHMCVCLHVCFLTNLCHFVKSWPSPLEIARREWHIGAQSSNSLFYFYIMRINWVTLSLSSPDGPLYRSLPFLKHQFFFSFSSSLPLTASLFFGITLYQKTSWNSASKFSLSLIYLKSLEGLPFSVWHRHP